jgi:hypothetical protein
MLPQEHTAINRARAVLSMLHPMRLAHICVAGWAPTAAHA